MRRAVLPAVALLLTLSLPARATRPEHAVFEGYDDLAAGKCVGTSLSDDGILAAGPTVAKLADLGVEQTWSVLAMPDGSVLAGTAPDGKLLRIGSDGTVKLVAKFDESHIYALARGPHGEIYAATSPDGKIYRVGDDGKPVVWFEPKEKYIWALLAAPDGTLYAGTGTRGRIYRITGQGAGELWYDSNETHIRALALDRDGAVLAGSAASGYLYRITGKDAAVVLADTGHEEVNQIVVAPDGAIWFTATGAAHAASGNEKKPAAEAASAPDAAIMDLRDLLITDGQHGGGTPGGMAPAAGGASALYRLDTTLYPQLLWQTKETILSLAWDDANGRALVGTGNNGYTYAVTAHGEARRLAKVDSDSVTALAMSGDGAVLATSNPGRLFRLGHDLSRPGVYESDVVDSAAFAKWGAVTLGASSPDAVKILTRSGNTAVPDKTWYPWVDTLEGRSQSAPARYLQVQLQITVGTVERIDATYLPRNLPPHIDSIKILPVGIGYEPIQSPAPWPSPRSAEQLLSAPDQPDSDDNKPQTRWQAVTGHGLRTVTWKASDPNNDELTYTVAWRKEGDADWHELAKDIKETVLSWDTTAWPDGRYELKVTASDADANAPGEGLTDEMVSRALLIDNTPPVITVISHGGGSVEFTVSDELGGLSRVTISTDGRRYRPVEPVEGIVGPGVNRFVVKIEPGQPLFIRAEDGSGNVAGTQVGG